MLLLGARRVTPVGRAFPFVLKIPDLGLFSSAFSAFDIKRFFTMALGLQLAQENATRLRSMSKTGGFDFMFMYTSKDKSIFPKGIIFTKKIYYGTSK